MQHKMWAAPTPAPDRMEVPPAAAGLELDLCFHGQLQGGQPLELAFRRHRAAAGQRLERRVAWLELAAWSIAAAKELLTGDLRAAPLSLAAALASAALMVSSLLPHTLDRWGLERHAEGAHLSKSRCCHSKAESQGIFCSVSAAPNARALALPQHACRLHYPLAAAVNLLQCAVGCVTHGALYPARAPSAGALRPWRALMLACIGNGPAWMAFFTCFSPLPFRFMVACACACCVVLCEQRSLSKSAKSALSPMLRSCPPQLV
jgi:hypothetical protein